MIEAISQLSAAAWRDGLSFAERPSDDDLAGPTLRNALIEGYNVRKARWGGIVEAITTSLSAAEFALVQADVAAVNDMFAQYDEKLASSAIAARDEKRGSTDSAEIWFYAAQSPDLTVPFRMVAMRSALERAAPPHHPFIV